MKKRPALLLALLFGSFAVVSCGGDRAPSTAPLHQPSAPAKSLLGLNLSVPIVTRLVPLPLPVSWSFVASPLGSSASNLTSGLTVVVPAGAVTVPTLITVTAESGAPVAYDFQPVGLHFAKPITLVQNLSVTSLVNGLIGSSPQGAYFASSQLQYDATTGTGVINEWEPTSTNWLLMQSRISVSHFSGYTMASCSSTDLLQ